MKKIAIALAFAAAAVAPAAHAAPSEPRQNIPFISYTTNIGGTFGNDNPTTFPPLFNNAFRFTTTLDRFATVEITSSHPTGDFSRNVNFVSNGVTLNATLIPATSTGQNERRYLANFRLPAGIHEIVVRGASGPNGAYSGVLSLISVVPEPSTWALMILGFGAVGGALRRRTKTSVSFA